MKPNKNPSLPAGVTRKPVTQMKGSLMHNHSTFYNSKQPVFRYDGKPVGFIQGTILKKSVASKKHMLQRPRGWAWDVDILDEAEKQGATHIEIYEKESRKTYKSTIQAFWDYGIGFNRGYGDQIVLPLNYWEIINPGDHPAQQLAFAF